MLLPLAPGVESIWEPLKEEFEESRDKVEQRYRDVMEGGLWHALCGLPPRLSEDRHCSCLSRQPLLILCFESGRCCRHCVLRCFTCWHPHSKGSIHDGHTSLAARTTLCIMLLQMLRSRWTKCKGMHNATWSSCSSRLSS